MPEIFFTSGDELGFSPKILRDAKKRNNIKSWKIGMDYWVWEWPDLDHKNDDDPIYS